MPATMLPDAEVERWIKAYLESSDNPDWQEYTRKVAANLGDRFLWLMKHLVELTQANDGRVLDVGCGFGWQAVAVSLLGNNHVVANDIRETMTAPLADAVEKVKAKGAPISVDTLTGDICALGIKDNSFDAIICNQTIEHVHDLDRMFKTCYAILKPGGRMVLTNDNNCLNHEGMREIQTKWTRRDTDWDYIEELKKEKPIENEGIQPYGVMREEIVRKSNGSLDDDSVKKIVDATAGMIEVDIADLASSYTPETVLPTRPELSWCRNPVTMEYCERQLDPYAVVTTLKAQGFRANVRHGFRKAPLSWFNGLQLPVVTNYLFQLRPFFIVVAEKPA